MESYFHYKMKRGCFQAVDVMLKMYMCTTTILTKYLVKQLKWIPIGGIWNKTVVVWPICTHFAINQDEQSRPATAFKEREKVMIMDTLFSANENRLMCIRSIKKPDAVSQGRLQIGMDDETLHYQHNPMIKFMVCYIKQNIFIKYYELLLSLIQC